MLFLALWTLGGSSQQGAKTEKQREEQEEGIYSLHPPCRQRPHFTWQPTPQPALSPSPSPCVHLECCLIPVASLNLPTSPHRVSSSTSHMLRWSGCGICFQPEPSWHTPCPAPRPFYAVGSADHTKHCFAAPCVPLQVINPIPIANDPFSFIAHFNFGTGLLPDQAFGSHPGPCFPLNLGSHQ